MPDAPVRRPGRRLIAASLATALLLGGVGFALLANRFPATWNMAEMGYADFGGGPVPADHQNAHGGRGHEGTASTSLATLVARTGIPDVRVQLTATAGRVILPDGRQVDGYALNGQTPGPAIEATQGDLVEVVLTNSDVAAGVTLHWHGLDVPNAMDGVAGVTQDAVGPGQSYAYRFVVDQVGSYWYHSHQLSHPQVLGGLLGPLVVRPRGGLGDVVDATALVHNYGGVRTINGRASEIRVDAAPGRTARVRVINTDNEPMPVWVAGTSYRILAVDGTDVNGPTPVSDRGFLLTAGARVDLGVTLPADGGAVRIQMANASVLVGSGTAPTAPAPRDSVDLLSYGLPTGSLPDPARADRTFDYAIGRAPGLLDGKPGWWWTINGGLFPNVPMFMVTEGDLVVMRISNTSGEAHPMHLHGHHVTVLAHNGVPASGSPWVVDSLHVEHGGSYVIAFTADNPGIWMDHCHNLPHASEGLMTHLAYVGFSTPFLVGGDHTNHPE